MVPGGCWCELNNNLWTCCLMESNRLKPNPGRPSDWESLVFAELLWRLWGFSRNCTAPDKPGAWFGGFPRLVTPDWGPSSSHGQEGLCTTVFSAQVTPWTNRPLSQSPTPWSHLDYYNVFYMGCPWTASKSYSWLKKQQPTWFYASPNLPMQPLL